ncbi:MAG: DinB family protein [bacterium]
MATQHDKLAQAFIAECERRLFEESLPRLKKCLAQLTEAEIWYRPNSETVSVGNLVLHLCGNVRQWILSGLGNAPDTRKRSQEFAEKGPIATERLIRQLEDTLTEVRDVLSTLHPADLLTKRPVQAFEESGVAILVHVVEHFSYHVGQIAYFVKSSKAIDLQYYPGIDLSKTTEG